MHVEQHSPATSKSCKLVSYVEHKLHSLEASRDLGLLCDSCMGVKGKGVRCIQHSRFVVCFGGLLREPLRMHGCHVGHVASAVNRCLVEPKSPAAASVCCQSV